MSTPFIDLELSCRHMLSSKRISILTRPVKAPGRVNEESVDAQFEKEQALLNAKRQRLASSEESLRRGHADKRSAEEKLQLLNESKAIYDEHKTIHDENERRRAELEALALRERLAREQAEVDGQVRLKQQQQQEAREVMEANKRLADERRERERQDKLRAHLQDRVNLAIQQEALEKRSFL